ncbi:MAG: SPFH domain-containing protein [Candidatus Aminicenantes bacterium]|nr:SPFH domain-containing protein [Candidatus Aminicenantes bacterium]
MTLPSILITAGIILVILALFALLVAKQYKKVGPNEALIISGRKKTVTGPDGAKVKVGYRYRLGGGTFVMPFLETVDTLPMEVVSLSIRTPEVLTHGGVPILADATAQVKIDSSESAIMVAAEQFLGIGKDGIREVAVNVLEGRMREVIGTMTVEEIYRGRAEFNEKVVAAAKADLSKMGLVLLAFALKEFSDPQGYINSLSKPLIMAAKRDAAISEAEGEKEAVIKSSQARKEAEVARLQADAQIAKAQWENETKKSDSLTLVNQKKAQADFAYELERHRLNQDIKREEAKVRQVEKEQAIKIEELEILRREKELEANVIKPSDARKYQIKSEAEAEEYRIQAEAHGKAEAVKMEGLAEASRIKEKGTAEAEAMLKKAQSMDKYGDAAILEMYMKVLPEVVRGMSEPLSKVDKIVVVGGDKSLGTTKITAQMAEILAQVPDVLQSLTGADIKKFLKDKLTSEGKPVK